MRRPSHAIGLENSWSQTSTASWWTSVTVGGKRRLQSGVRNASVLMLSTTRSKSRRRMSSRWTSSVVRAGPETSEPLDADAVDLRRCGCARETRGEKRHLVALRDPLLRHLVREDLGASRLLGSRGRAS